MPLTPAEKHARKVHNERVKLTAAFVNTLAAGLMIVGLLNEVLGRVETDLPLWGLTLLLMAALGLHWIARASLRRMKPEDEP